MNYSARLTALLGVSVALVQVQTAQALTKAEVSRVAQGVTVLIQNAQNLQDTGSGVIIKREGETYTVLTAHHVVERSPDYKLMTPDEKQHPMVQGSIQSFPGVDLALIKFKSSESYSVAKLGDSTQSPLGTASFVAGFPGITEVRSAPTFYFTSGEIAANANHPLKDGYAIAYNNPTLPGMSGGPVLNEQGELIGIHGRAESAERPQNSQLQSNIYVLKTEFNYAIPINTFLSLAPQVNKTLAFRIINLSVSSAPKADDFLLQAEEKSKGADYKGAITDFNEVLRLNPSYKAAYTSRGFARVNAGDDKGALADFNQAINLSPRDADAYSGRGFVRERLGDDKGAITDYNQAISLNPKLGRAYANRGFAREQLGNKQGALADYNQAIRLNPRDADAYVHRGHLRDKLGDKQGALADSSQSEIVYGNLMISNNPLDGVGYAYRGGGRKRLGDKQEALADYNHAIKLGTKDTYNYSAIYSNRAILRNELGDKNGAIADYNQAINLSNTSSNYNGRAVVRNELGDKKGAIADYSQAISLSPDFSLSYSGRAVVLNELGDKKGAIADYSQAINLSKILKNPTDYENRGLIRNELGDKKGAIADLQTAAALHKNENHDEESYQRVLKKIKQINGR